jgi:NhaP-type Na+/H+ or K+/H+ antiporter
VLLVSGVFILLAAAVDLSQLAALNVWAILFVASVILVVRPTTVLVSLLGSSIAWRERVLVAFTGPRGVVLVAVAGLFGVRLSEIGVADADQIAPLAFALVMATVVLHGFSLKPIATALGLAGGTKPGVLIVGANSWGTSVADALHRAEVPVLLVDRNMRNLRAVRDLGVPT